MVETLPPIPKTLPSVSDAEYQALISSRDIYSPDWKSRHTPLKLHQGYSHINENCVTCKGKGEFRWLNKQGDPATYLCPCLDQWILDTLFAAANIHQNFRVLGVDDALVEGIPPKSLEWMAERTEGQLRTSAIIMGGPSSGKTLMATLIMRAYLREGNTAFLTRADHMRNLKTASFNEKGELKVEIEARYTRKIANVDLLVVDELERVTTSEFMVGSLDRLIRDRRSSGLATILIAGKKGGIIDLESLTKKYWDAKDTLKSMDFHLIGRGSFGAKLMEREHDERQKGLTRPRVLT